MRRSGAWHSLSPALCQPAERAQQLAAQLADQAVQRQPLLDQGAAQLELRRFIHGATSYHQSSGGNLVPNISFAIDVCGPGKRLIYGGELPGRERHAAQRRQGNLRAADRKISAVAFNAKLDEEHGVFVRRHGGRAQQRKSFSDSTSRITSRSRPNLNINYGLRWEAALAPEA